MADRKRDRSRARSGSLGRTTLRRLARLGLDFAPYVVYLEHPAVSAGQVSAGYQAQPITATSVEPILQRYSGELNADKWRERVGAGDFGLLLERGTELVGYTWASTRCFIGIDNYPLFELAEHEAYLFDMYVAATQRGHGIAGLLCNLMYAQLVAQGRTAYYSFTLSSNASARRFKLKIGAAPLELRLRIALFWTWSFDLRLRQWVSAVPTRRTYGYKYQRRGR